MASTLAPNPDLKPERQTEIEAGFELGFWNDRALIDFTYYDQTTDDLVLSIPLPPSSSYQARRENIGELTNRGVELALSTVNKTGGDWSWRTRVQFAANRNEVTRLVTDADTIVSGYLNAVIEGQPVGVFYGGIYARNPDGTLTGDADGIETSGDQPVGDPDGRFVCRLNGVDDPLPAENVHRMIHEGDRRLRRITLALRGAGQGPADLRSRPAFNEALLAKCADVGSCGCQIR